MNGTVQDMLWLYDFVWALFDTPIVLYGFTFSLRQVLLFGVSVSWALWGLRQLFGAGED